jgi:hypothetical protein
VRGEVVRGMGVVVWCVVVWWCGGVVVWRGSTLLWWERCVKSIGLGTKGTRVLEVGGVTDEPTASTRYAPAGWQ